MRKNIPWQAIRHEYELGGEGVTTKFLAKKYGLSYLSVRNRCTRDGWRTSQGVGGKTFNSALTQRIQEKALSLAERASAFHERNLLEGEDLLKYLVSEVKPLLNRRDVDGIRKFVSAWVELTEVLRTVHKLDDHTEPKTTGLVQIVLTTGQNSQFKVVEHSSDEPEAEVTPSALPADIRLRGI